MRGLAPDRALGKAKRDETKPFLTHRSNSDASIQYGCARICDSTGMTPIHLADRNSPRAPRKVPLPARLTPAAGLFGWRRQDEKISPDKKPAPGRDYPVE
jgi:hypothetical protein